MKNPEFTVIALSDTPRQGIFAVVLEAVDGEQRLFIQIGRAEAQQIAIAIQQRKTLRPSTHSLLATILKVSQIKLVEVTINDYKDGVFHALLILKMHDSSLTEVDCRPSDAITLSLNYGCPIRVSTKLLETYEPALDPSGIKVSLEDYTQQALKLLLATSLKKEDFELAARIQKALDAKLEK